MTDTDATIRVLRNDEAGRYEIRVDDEVAGFTQFRADREGRLIFPHTEVDPAYAGQGLAGRLVGEAMADVAGRGETVVPRCPFVAKYLRGHDVDGLVIAWPPSRAAEDER
ncbi:MAG: family N-acetyltransferase [Microbacterium sp.]|jgi:predicted GNAT family acetyltransferase|nr:family N-acetyltransferase [Microbacterium sp.]